MVAGISRNGGGGCCCSGTLGCRLSNLRSNRGHINRRAVRRRSRHGRRHSSGNHISCLGRHVGGYRQSDLSDTRWRGCDDGRHRGSQQTRGRSGGGCLRRGCLDAGSWSVVLSDHRDRRHGRGSDGRDINIQRACSHGQRNGRPTGRSCTRYDRNRRLRHSSNRRWRNGHGPRERHRYGKGLPVDRDN